MNFTGAKRALQDVSFDLQRTKKAEPVPGEYFADTVDRSIGIVR
jgi:hypothetical protein